MKKILIVDDEFLIRYSLSHILQTQSVFVTAVSSGHEAINELAGIEFDVCCLDIHLPDMNGIDIMKRIKSKTPGTRILVMTGGTVTKEMMAEIQNNAVLLLSKPFDLFKVKSFVDRLLATSDPLVSRDELCERQDIDCSLNKDQRRHERRLVSGSVSCAVLLPGQKQTAELLNVSDDGMCLLTPFPLPAGAVITVSTGNPDMRTCAVRWTAKTDADVSYRSGLQFLTPQPPPKSSLNP